MVTIRQARLRKRNNEWYVLWRIINLMYLAARKYTNDTANQISKNVAKNEFAEQAASIRQVKYPVYKG